MDAIKTVVRKDYSEADTWLHVLPMGELMPAFACYGALDARENMPAGSMLATQRQSITARHEQA